MRLCIRILATVLAVMTTGCASTANADRSNTPQAEETTISTATAQEATADTYDPDEVVCKKTKKVGTRLKTKVCATRREWELYEEHAQNTTEEIQRQGSISIVPETQ